MRTDYFDSLKAVQEHLKEGVTSVAGVAKKLNHCKSDTCQNLRVPHFPKKVGVKIVAEREETTNATFATSYFSKEVAKKKETKTINSKGLAYIATPPHVPPLKLKEVTEEEQENYLERAGIMQFDGGLSREEAEEEAFKIVFPYLFENT